MEERNVLIKALKNNKSSFIPLLYECIQDELNLYLVMEYCIGGDLYGLLLRLEDNGVMKETDSAFYIAEVICGVEELHKMGYLHRDIKPKNILIDKSGHLKIADFGSCVELNKDGQVVSSVAVGTSDYISPEILMSQENSLVSNNFDRNNKAYACYYDTRADWWSVGIVLYEMLQGDPPFYSDTVAETHARIMSHKENLIFQEEMYPISKEAKQLIKELICDKEERLGKPDALEIKQHAFFKKYNIDFDNVLNKKLRPPYITKIGNELDTSNFDEYKDEFVHTKSKISNNAPSFINNNISSNRLSINSNNYNNRNNEELKQYITNESMFVGFTYCNIESKSTNNREKQEMYELILELEKKMQELTLENKSKQSQLEAMKKDNNIYSDDLIKRTLEIEKLKKENQDITAQLTKIKNIENTNKNSSVIVSSDTNTSNKSNQMNRVKSQEIDRENNSNSNLKDKDDSRSMNSTKSSRLKKKYSTWIKSKRDSLFFQFKSNSFSKTESSNNNSKETINVLNNKLQIMESKNMKVNQLYRDLCLYSKELKKENNAYKKENTRLLKENQIKDEKIRELNMLNSNNIQ